jgi:hypothetical protein
MTKSNHMMRFDDEVWAAVQEIAFRRSTSGSRVSVNALTEEFYRGLAVAEGLLAEPGKPVLDPAAYPDGGRAPTQTVKRRRPGGAPVAAELARERSQDRRAADCPHPKARVSKGMCGACGTGGL